MESLTKIICPKCGQKPIICRRCELCKHLEECKNHVDAHYNAPDELLKDIQEVTMRLMGIANKLNGFSNSACKLRTADAAEVEQGVKARIFGCWVVHPAND